MGTTQDWELVHLQLDAWYTAIDLNGEIMGWERQDDADRVSQKNEASSMVMGW